MLSAQAAIAQLVRIGYEPALARETVFIALGGDDVIDTDTHGVRRYFSSGKTVGEVDRLMKLSEGERMREEALKNGFVMDDAPTEKFLDDLQPDSRRQRAQRKFCVGPEDIVIKKKPRDLPKNR